jgi:hypothetical protein
MGKHTDAFNAWKNQQSPANAVALAAEDHKHGAMVDWPFVDALNKASAMAQSHEALVAALEKWEEFMQANYAPSDITWWEETRAALALARGEA